jgi:uncharacterized protein
MGKNPYTIQFGGLPVGIHEYEFEIKDAFFKTIENSYITKADIAVKAMLTKQNNVLHLDFDISGSFGSECDRCLKDFNFPISTKEKLIIKHGNPDESTDEISVIPEGMDEVNIAHYIYEYIVLSIPARRVPCEIDAKLYECDFETLAKLNEISADFETEKEPLNPIWEQLNKLKNNNNH